MARCLARLSLGVAILGVRHRLAFDGSVAYFMPVRRLVWRTCYGLLAKQVPTPDWAFMNYGYASTMSDIEQPPMALSDEQNRLCIQLYLHAVDGTDLAGKDVLEVGSGRGGGAFFISRQLRPRTMTGLDFSQEAVRLCNRYRRAPGLTFVWGDALSIPFPDASFDAVVNIESSHCYEDMDRFLSEVHRVLRPGGGFFFADLRSRDGAQDLCDQFDSCGLTVERRLDITPNVLAALKIDSMRRLGLIEALIPRLFHRPFRAFAGIEGTLNYRRLESGAWRYISAHLSKSSPSPT